MYWIAIIIGFLALRHKETHGNWPFLKAPAAKSNPDRTSQTSSSIRVDAGETEIVDIEKGEKALEAGQSGKIEIREVRE